MFCCVAVKFDIAILIFFMLTQSVDCHIAREETLQNMGKVTIKQKKDMTTSELTQQTICICIDPCTLPKDYCINMHFLFEINFWHVLRYNLFHTFWERDR